MKKIFLFLRLLLLRIFTCSKKTKQLIDTKIIATIRPADTSPSCFVICTIRVTRRVISTPVRTIAMTPRIEN